MGRVFLLLFLLTATVAVFEAGGPPTDYNGKEKLSHLNFFWHDTAGGQNPSAVTVAQSPISNISATRFGTVRVFDDPITAGPDPSSLLVGRSQGIYLAADQKNPGLLQAMTFSFLVGKYNGSTLSVLGRNQVDLHVREMPIVGGTGLLRFATGYVHAQTVFEDSSIGYFRVEYNVYFVHSVYDPSDSVTIPFS